MALIGTLVVGENNATSLAGGSSGLSTPADRERFLQLHRRAAAIIIGKNSAGIESYRRTQVPIFVFSRGNTPLHFDHPQMQQVRVRQNPDGSGDLGHLARLIDSRIPGDVVVEAGASLLQALIAENAIDELDLSISPISGDGDFIDLNQILAGFEILKESTVDGTRLLKCRNKSHASNGK